MEGSKHLGIHLEAFAAAPGQWEAIYVNLSAVVVGRDDIIEEGR